MKIAFAALVLSLAAGPVMAQSAGPQIDFARASRGVAPTVLRGNGPNHNGLISNRTIASSIWLRCPEGYSLVADLSMEPKCAPTDKIIEPLR